MNVIPRISRWVRIHWLAIFITIFVTLLDGLSQFPPYESIFIWQTWLNVIARIILSIWDLPVLIFSSLVQRRDLLIWIIPFWSMGLGLGIEWILSKPNHLLERLFIASLLFAPSGLCALGNLFLGVSVESVSACQKLISETNGVRVSVYETTDSMASFHLFLQSTNGAGKSWNKFYYSFVDWDAYDPLHFPKCENVRALNDQQFWVWNDYQIFVTRDSGTTWQSIPLEEISPNWRMSGGYQIIEDVEFADTQNAKLSLNNVLPNRPPKIAVSSDCGKTWHESSNYP